MYLMLCFVKTQKESFSELFFLTFSWIFCEIGKDKWISWDENGGLERFNRYVNMTNYNELILNENRNLSKITGTIKERKF